MPGSDLGLGFTLHIVPGKTSRHGTGLVENDHHVGALLNRGSLHGQYDLGNSAVLIHPLRRLGCGNAALRLAIYHGISGISVVWRGDFRFIGISPIVCGNQRVIQKIVFCLVKRIRVDDDGRVRFGLPSISMIVLDVPVAEITGRLSLDMNIGRPLIRIIDFV